MTRPTWNVWPPAIFAVIVLSFLAATGFGQWRMRVLDSAVVEIASTTAPSIEYLASARGHTRTLQTVLRERVSDMNGQSRDARDVASIEDARGSLDDTTKQYLALPVAAGERGVWRQILAAKEGIDHATMRFEAAFVQNDREAATTTLQGDFATAAADLDAATTAAIEFNAARSRDLALEIHHLRSSGLYAAIALDILCTAIAICGAILLRRTVRKHDALLERHRMLEAERASELEQFAGRVAHDILSPLSTVGLALELARRPGHDSERARFVDRGTKALNRVKRMVNGLLDFARAGACPDPDAESDVAEVMADLAEELAPTAEAAGATLAMMPGPPSIVACNPGVLTSLIANLTRNAIKYIGDGPVRHVAVRAIDRGDLVRVEVEDTGPGLPPGFEHRAFDAYSRSRTTMQPGIGLGLATVKRLAEVHGGRVGVRSIAGKGCTFWFELPKATATPVPAAAMHRASKPVVA
jgi:signal transduction histidine kinase